MDFSLILKGFLNNVTGDFYPFFNGTNVALCFILFYAFFIYVSGGLI